MESTDTIEDVVPLKTMYKYMINIISSWGETALLEIVPHVCRSKGTALLGINGAGCGAGL